MKAKTLLLVLMLLACLSAFSWNKSGHMIVATLAYIHLKDHSPGTIPKIIALLKKHPHFAAHWKADYDTKTGEDRDIYLFMMAARWPDDVRSAEFESHTYHHATWHYVNWPVTFSNVPTVQPSGEMILTAIDSNLATLRSTTASQKDKAISICWIFHLMGDLHQPLHNVALFSTTFQAGDKGGKDFFIKASSTGATLNLHAFWDDVILTSEIFDGVKNAATKNKTDNPSIVYNSTITPEYQTWSQAGVDLAKTKVYKHNGTLIKSGADKDHGHALPSGYTTAAKATASKQIATAGVRLAVVVSKTITDIQL
jgi:hypothetical protein